MTEELFFTLNRNQGVSTLHIDHPHEECNTDDAEGLEQVDPMTAEALVVRGDARRCEHCKPEPQG